MILDHRLDIPLGGGVSSFHAKHDPGHNLVRDLIAPLVDLRHVEVVDEEAHLHVPLWPCHPNGLTGQNKAGVKL